MMRRLLAACVLALGCAGAQAATIVVINGDGGGEGLNDPTPAMPEGGNPGLTLGEQRMHALRVAADVWAARIASSVPIKVHARFDPIEGCTAVSGVVGSAGATSQFDFGGQPPAGARADTFYPIALAEALAGANINGSDVEINATFNSAVDGPDCFGGKSFYYGTDPGTAPQTALAFFPVVLHELGHGLGFSSLSCTQPGGCGGFAQGAFLNAGNVTDVWGRFLAQAGGALWADMDDAQRAASMTSDPNLVWRGPYVTGTAAALTAGRNGTRVRMHAPADLAPGSSVSHFSSALQPDEVMEPVINLNSVVHDPGRAVPLMRDIGWTLSSGGAPVALFRHGFEN